MTVLFYFLFLGGEGILRGLEPGSTIRFGNESINAAYLNPVLRAPSSYPGNGSCRSKTATPKILLPDAMSRRREDSLRRCCESARVRFTLRARFKTPSLGSARR